MMVVWHLILEFVYQGDRLEVKVTYQLVSLPERVMYRAAFH